jgi:hypothetical protein
MSAMTTSVVEGAPSTSLLELRHASTDRAIFVKVPLRRFIAVDGVGRRSAADFVLASQVLRAAHAMLLADLRRRRLPAPVMRQVAECIWEPTVMRRAPDLRSALADLSRWRWRQMIEVPASATDDLTVAAIEQAAQNARLSAALAYPYTVIEGAVAQLLHLGAAGEIADTVLRLDDAVRSAGCVPVWPIHELALADPRVVSDQRGRTIIRLPFVAGRLVDVGGAAVQAGDGAQAGDAAQADRHPWRNHDF